MKAVGIGSGVSGLASAAYLARAGWEVTVFEQADHIGGVTALAEKDGFRWEQGPLMMGEFLPGEKVHDMLTGLGISLDLVPADRGISMPDYELWHPDAYEGPYWRRERLKELFPEEADGLDRYYRFSDDMLSLARLSENPRKSVPERIRMALIFLRVKKYFPLIARGLMERFFTDPKLRALYLGILADFCVSPSEFAGPALPFVNLETAFDRRIPLLEKGRKVRSGFCYVRGSIYRLVEELARVIGENGGTIRVSSPVVKGLVEKGAATGQEMAFGAAVRDAGNGDRVGPAPTAGGLRGGPAAGVSGIPETSRVSGVRLASGETVPADLVIGSGGGKEFFTRLVGREYLTEEYAAVVDGFRPMESVFMVHLGVNIDPLAYQKEALCYYYGNYDIEGALRRIRSGVYHGGDDGFLLYCPSAHTPELAPPGYHCVTLYTVAPDTLAEGDWESGKEAWADRLVSLAERIIPGLSRHIVTRLVKTPLDYRRMAFLDHSAFGGNVPDRNRKNPPHVTPVRNLYFVGAQSETQGGVSGCLLGARKVARLLGIDLPGTEAGLGRSHGHATV